jgi:hypothetical protein
MDRMTPLELDLWEEQWRYINEYIDQLAEFTSRYNDMNPVTEARAIDIVSALGLYEVVRL